jgi:murein DD-endopeptidase MepM/ murein hydrolase activator NlpD
MNRRLARVVRIAALATAIATIQVAEAAAELPYPLIPRLASGDPVYAQYSDDLAEARIALARRKPGAPLPVRFYAYKMREEDSLLSVAARLSVSYDSIASLNRIPSIRENLAGRILVIPSLPGLYLPDAAETSFEHLLLSSFDPDDPGIIDLAVRGPDGSRRAVHCIPDASFDGTVRAFFLKPTYRFPLPSGAVSSTYGLRKNPVTGNLVFHKGIDIAAPWGTPVLACAGGTVASVGSDPIYGNYVILSHPEGRESLYGHLAEAKVVLQQRVKSGTIIGIVGNTGQSTGPHLHFEIHEGGVPKNPAGFIVGK